MHSSRMLIMSCLNSFKEKLSGDYKTLLKAHGFQIYNHPKLPKSTHPIKFLQRCQPKTENQFSNHRNPMEIPWKPKKNTHPSSPPVLPESSVPPRRCCPKSPHWNPFGSPQNWALSFQHLQRWKKVPGNFMKSNMNLELFHWCVI